MMTGIFSLANTFLPYKAVEHDTNKTKKLKFIK